MNEQKEKAKPITTLGDISTLADCSRSTVSRAKNKRESVSMVHYENFAAITGIDKEIWIRGDRRILKRDLREFFKAQKFGR